LEKSNFPRHFIFLSDWFPPIHEKSISGSSWASFSKKGVFLYQEGCPMQRKRRFPARLKFFLIYGKSALSTAKSM
jgi:hypothetical protein